MKIQTPEHAMQVLQENAIGAQGAVFLDDHENVLSVETLALDTEQLTERALALGACALVVFQQRDMSREQRLLSHLESRCVKKALALNNLRVMDWFLVNGCEFFSLLKHGLL